MKKRSFFPVFYLVIVTLFTFVPIVVTIVYSFNASKLTSVWGGFSLTWYRRLFADTDIFRALKNSLILGALCCLASAVIGTLGAIGMKKTAYTRGQLPHHGVVVSGAVVGQRDDTAEGGFVVVLQDGDRVHVNGVQHPRNRIAVPVPRRLQQFFGI